MRKVYFIWFFKKVLPYALADIFVFGVFLYIVGEYTFVRVVMENFVRILLSSPASLMPYLADAALNAKFVVNMSLAGATIAMILAFKNVLALFVQLRVFKEETNLRRGVFY
ncbi:MAG: hypothetical protein AAB527_00045 [Patescibacteria group bacterium]